MQDIWRRRDGWRSAGRAVSFALVGLLMPPTLMAQDQQPAPVADTAQVNVPLADPGDVESIEAIVAAVYEIISGEKGEARDWDRLRSLYIPEARLIETGRRRDGTHVYRVMSIENYISGPGNWLVNNGFFEGEVHSVVERWADIAQVFSTYNSYHTAADMEAGNAFHRGINSIQLMYRDDRWWIVSVLWEGEPPNQPISPRYLGHGSGN